MAPDTLTPWRSRLTCNLPAVQAVADVCLTTALRVLRADDLARYIDWANALGRMGRGADPVLAWLEAWPEVAEALGAELPLAQDAVENLSWALQKSPNGPALAPLLQSLGAVARRLQGAGPLCAYLAVVRDLMQRSTVSIHGHHATFASPGLPVLLAQAPMLLSLLSVEGLARWVDYGVRHYRHDPDRQREYFAVGSAESRSVLQRQRRGVLFSDVQRQLEATLRALWDDDSALHACQASLDPAAPPVPWIEPQGLVVPEVYDDWAGVSALDRYRVALAHLAAHRRWSAALIADNLSPLQRLTLEALEDARVDVLTLRQLPGLRPVMLALHPHPREDACDTRVESGVRHRLTMLSRACLDAAHGYTQADLLDTVAAFHAALAGGASSTADMRELALRYAARTRRQSDQLARVRFEDTRVTYRDDNRHLWTFIEQGDEEDTATPENASPPAEPEALPPRHYPEWDRANGHYRPDWVSVYESLHPSGDASQVTALLARHARLARELQRWLDALKPQDRVRWRYQEQGSELDLDVALRALIDWRAGAAPDPRILQSHRPNERHVAVMVLLDLSESLNDMVPGTAQTRIALSQEAVALLMWAIDRLGDRAALAGFHSDTRHALRYQHIKGFSEAWDEVPMARLAAIRAGGSTRMGGAMRHAAHYLGAQAADKKLMLLLTDGRPSDVDVADDQHLVADAHKAVQELAQQGILCHCISLDPQADDYVHDIFGHHASVVDRIEQLPSQLARLFLRLTA